MSQNENGDKETPSETTEYHVNSTNLFDKGNTPFRRSLGTNSITGTNSSPTRQNAKNPNNSTKLLKITKVTKIDAESKGEDGTTSLSVNVGAHEADQTAGSSLNVEEISNEIPSFSASLAMFEKEWNSIIDKYSNVEDQGDVVDLASGSIVKNNGHLELLEDEEETIWDCMFPIHKEGEGKGDEAAVSGPPTPSLLQQLGEFQSDSEDEVEEKEENTTKKRRISLWDV